MSVYGIAMFGLTVLAVVLVSPLLYLLPAKMVLTTVMLLVVPLTAIRMISDYVCYRRIFHREERVEKGERRFGLRSGAMRLLAAGGRLPSNCGQLRVLKGRAA